MVFLLPQLVVVMLFGGASLGLLSLLVKTTIPIALVQSFTMVRHGGRC